MGKQWGHSEHAPASNTGHCLFPPGFQAHFQGGVRGSSGTELDNLVSKGNVKMYQGQLQFAVIPPSMGEKVKESIHL